MDTENDSINLSPDAPPPLPLKRLKRAPSRAPDDPVPSPPGPPEIPHSAGDDELEPLFADGQFTGCEAGDLARQEVRGEDGESSGRKRKSAKKKLCLDGEEEKVEKKRRKKRNGSDGGDGDSRKESIRENRRIEKERQAYLEQLHAESQRLLRETKNASFKSAPIVQKPISSVLEKIRLRKLEVLKRCNEIYNLESPVNDESYDNNLWGPIISCSQSGKSENSANAKEPQNKISTTNKIDDDDDVGVHDSSNGTNQLESVLNSNVGDMHYVPEAALQNSSISPVKYEESRKPGKRFDSLPDNSSSQENVSSLPITTSKSDADLSDDTSSDDEDFNKENDDPLKNKPSHTYFVERTNLAKDFVDDEAEEDDSDHDKMIFSEEDDDGKESDEVNDLISTAYKEMPADQERRTELHQQWLEQQDAAETNNVLQRLKQHQRKTNEKTTLSDENSTEELDEGAEDNSLLKDIPANAARENSKRAKQMMAQMFDAKDDGFVSDDEEIEHNLSRQRILEKTEKDTLILAQEDNANSNEVFNLIKKMNIAPDPMNRIRPAPTTYKPLHLCGNSNSSSKSSFLGRATSKSLPSSHKQSNATFKSFVFGRDDSNSRSAISKPEDLPDTDRKEKEPQHTRTGSAKFTGSQPKSICSVSNPDTSGPSLFEILRHSSLIYDQQLKASNQKNRPISETQAARQLTAFKLRGNAPKRSIQESSSRK